MGSSTRPLPHWRLRCSSVLMVFSCYLGPSGSSEEERIKQCFLSVTEGKLSPHALQSLGNAPTVRAPAQRPFLNHPMWWLFPFFPFSPFPRVERERGNHNSAVELMVFSIFCWRSWCMLKAKGSAMPMPVCVSRGGIADNAVSGDLPALLLTFFCLENLPFIGQSERGLKIGLITVVRVGPGLPSHHSPLCSPLTLPV